MLAEFHISWVAVLSQLRQTLAAVIDGTADAVPATIDEFLISFWQSHRRG
jgi:hypothetical protein